MTSLRKLLKGEKGATAIEYALIAALVGIGLITGLNTLKGGISGVFTKTNTTLGNAVK
jgi:pilus assembly protein Flp/PilA